MILAATQPTYLPWLGYFELMHRADVFVSYDHVQFSKQSWQQRNRLRGRDGELLLTVPVQHAGSRTLRDVRVVQGPWQRKHWASLRSLYERTRHGPAVLERLRPVYEARWERLVDLNEALIRVGREELGITTPMHRSTSLGLPEGKNEALIELCRLMKADVYYSPAGSREYMDLEAFARAGIEVRFQSYAPPPYPQADYPDHISHLSFVDYLCNAGPAEVAPW